MPDIVSEPPEPAEHARYQFNFAWKSPYGHVVRMIEQLGITSGVVLDIGCGFGAVAEPLKELGLEYLGCDIDKDALDDLSARGFTAFQVDLLAHEGLAGVVQENLSAEQLQQVKIVLILDVMEHLPFTEQVLPSIRRTLTVLGNPALVISVPNIAHFDIGAKLAFGLFDYTPTGLLDDTHLSFFTESRLAAEFAKVGLRQIAGNDFHLYESDQHFPPSHPGIAPGAPLAHLIRHWRAQVDDASSVNQFIRAFAAIPSPDEPAEQEPEPDGVFLTVLMRTQAARPECLKDALTCLAAQTCDDMEVKLLVHGHDAMVEKVSEIVGQYHPTFFSRVEVVQVIDGGRARPLNVGLERAKGKYIAFLDDDDVVTADWVEVFKQGMEDGRGRIVRSVTVNQKAERQEPGSLAPFLLRSGFDRAFQATFDLGLHFYRNQTPICSFAVPRSAAEAFRLRFDEDLPVTEDWDFFLRAAQITGVHDTRRVTSIYRRWVCGDGSEASVDQKIWDGVRRSILHRFDQAPLLLPPGSASKMAEYRELAANAPDIHAVHAEMKRLAALVDGYENSLSWKVTRPIRLFLHHARKRLRH